MGLAKKHVAELIVELEGQVALGHEYARSADVLPVLHEALTEFQKAYTQVARMAELVEALSTAQ